MVGSLIGPGTPWNGSTALDDEQALAQAMELSPKQLRDRDPSSAANGQAGADTPPGAANTAAAKSLQSKYPPIMGNPVEAKRNEAHVERGPSTVKGFDAASSKELPDRRTERERTYANSDGTYTTEFSRDPVNYRTADGTYAPIDPSLMDAGDEWRNRADAVDFRFAKRSDAQPLVQVSVDRDHEVAFGISGASAAVGQVNAATVIYPNARPSSDVRIDMLPGGFKETLILQSPDAPHEWTFPLRLKGLTASVVDGRVAFTDEHGTERLRFPAGFMTDASETGATSYGVTYEIVDKALVMRLDSAWLKDPARRYPVAVDPSVETFTSNSSMYVEGSTRRDGGTELHAGFNGSVSAASYLKFDSVRTKLTDHKIFGAQLALTNLWSWSCDPRPLTVHEVTAAWGTSGGFPGPAFGPALTSQSFAHGYIAQNTTYSRCPTATEVINLGEGGRDAVQRWANGGNNFGLTVRASQTDRFGWKKFTGRSTANPPRLYVTHSAYDADYHIENGVIEPPVTRIQGGKLKITVTNRGAQTWTPSTFALGYRAFTSQGRPVDATEAASLPHDVPRGASVTLEATVKPMEPDDYYLDFSMLQRGGPWFTDEQIPPARLVLRVIDIPPVVKAQYPPNGFSAQTLTPQLWVDAVDLDAPPNLAPQYRFEICENYVKRDDGTLEGVGCTDSGYVNSRYWTVPVGALRWSKDYQWRAFGYDGHSESQALPPSHLLTAVPQPEITAHLANAPYSGSNSDFDPQTGNYYSSAIDTSVATTGPDLTVVRTYNSLDPRRDLTFGAGWSTRYDMRVVPDEDGSGNVVVTYPDGQQMRFGRNADGSFAAPPGRSANFHAEPEQSGGGWILVDQESTSYRFRPDGRLITIFDQTGHWIELDYGTPEKLKRAISRTSDRILYFTWSGSHVASVSTDVINGKQLTWTYTYDGDKLTKVCDPKGGCTTYDYAGGSHYRSVVIDSRPTSYWRLGEPDGTVATSQVRTNLEKDNGTYKNVTLKAPGPLAGTSDTAVSFNGTSSAITLPNGTLRKSRDLAVELWFKTTSGGPLIGYQNKKVEETPTESTPILYVGTDGKLRGQFAYGTTEPITSTTAVNDDKWHHAVLSGSLATQSLYLDGQLVDTAEGEIVHSDLTFNQIGTAYAIDPAEWPQWGTTQRRYFAGQIDEVAYYEHPVGPTSVLAHYKARAASDNLTKITLPSGRTAAKLGYDEINDRVRDYTDTNGGTWKLSVPIVTGNPDNVVRTVQVTDPGNRPHFYDYDPMRGRILRYSAPLGLGVRDEDRRMPNGDPKPPTQPTCPPNPVPPPPDEDPVYCGGPVGGGGEWTGGPVKGQGVRNYDYDDKGFQNTITDENGNSVVLTTDERGNVTARKTCRIAPGDCQIAYSSYYFNPADSTDPRNNKITSSRDARSSGPDDTRFATTYAYTDIGARGLLASTKTPDGAVVSHTYTTESTAAIGGGNTPAGLVATTTDPRNAVTRYGYYANGDLAQITNPAGLLTKFTYDVLGRKITETQISDAFPQGLTTTYAYDELSRRTVMTAPATTNTVTGVKHTLRTTTSYDADGHPLRTEASDLTGGDPTRVTTAEYDEFGRPSRVTNPEGAATTRGYDGFGNLTWTVDANGNKTEFAYTARNKIAEVRLRAWHGNPVDPGGNGGDGEGGSTPQDTLVLESYGYDLAGRLIRQTDAVGRQTRYEYFTDDTVRRVIARDVRDPFNPTAPARSIMLQQNTYDAAGNLTQQTSATGRVTTNDYDAVGRISATVIDPAGLNRKTAFDYDKSGNVIKVTRTGNSSNSTRLDVGRIETVEYGFDLAGRETSETVYNGQERLVTTRTYDQRGQIRTITDPRGNAAGAVAANFTSDFGYDELKRQTVSTTPPVQTERVGGQPSTERLVTRTNYDTFGEATHLTDAAGNVTTRFYDRRGLPTRTESAEYRKPGESTAARSVTQTQYDAVGNTIAVIDPRGAVTRYRYDQLNRRVESQDPKHDAPTEVGGISRMTYTNAGQLLSSTDPTGARTEATYDDLGRQVTATQLERRPQPAAYTTKLQYNDDGDLTQTTSPSGEITQHSYDKAGERLTTTDPAGVLTKFGYDMAGNPVRFSDGLGRTQYTQHDGAGRPVAQYDLDAQERILRKNDLTYDKAGNVLTLTDALSHTKKLSYDALGQVTRQEVPVSDTDSIVTTFGYDARGALTRSTDGRGNSTIHTYNTFGLPQTVVEPATTAHPNASDRTWTYGYDLAANATTVNAPGGVTRQRTYDFLGRLTRETGTGAEAATDDRVATYDLAGRLTTINAPLGPNSYTYNDRSDLLSTQGSSGNSTFSYDANGRLLERTDGAGTHTNTYANGRLATLRDGITGVTQTLGYDDAGAVKSIDYGSGRTRSYTYDDLSRLRTDTLKNGTTAVAAIGYDYDTADRLSRKTTTGTGPAQDNTYGYDHAARLTSWTNNGTTKTYAWDKAGNRTLNEGKTATYDERNRLTSDGDYTYTWSPRGTLATRASSGFNEQQKFDAFDRTAGTSGTTYRYDGLGRLSVRDDKPLTYLGTSLEVVSDGTATYSRSPGGSLVALKQGADKRLTMSDQHTDLVGGFNPDTPLTSLTDTATYDPFGKTLNTTGTKRSLGYQGDYTDPTTGNIDMGARWYNPGTGGFTTRDSIPSGNRYGYALGSPVNATDSDGHRCFYIYPPARVPGIDYSCDSWLEHFFANRGAYPIYCDYCPYPPPPPPPPPCCPTGGPGSIPGSGSSSGSTGGGGTGRGSGSGGGRGSGGTGGGGSGGGVNATQAAREAATQVARTNPLPVPQAATQPLYSGSAGNGVQPPVSATPNAPAHAVGSSQVVDQSPQIQRMIESVMQGSGPVIQNVSEQQLSEIVSSGGKVQIIPGADGSIEDPNGPKRFGPNGKFDFWAGLGHAFETIGHDVLDLIGMVPVVGEVADGINAAWYLAEGDYVNAAFSAASAIPGLGWGAAAAKQGNKALKEGDELIDAAASFCRRQSFVAGTLVLMADGTRKPIEQLVVGDKVVATDPTTGQTGDHEITDVRSNWGEKHLVETTVANDTSTAGKITSTDEHPFWVESEHRWVNAKDLKPGYRLETADHRDATVTTTRTWTQHERVYNLTVDTLHTYYVDAAATPVLVHNCGEQEFEDFAHGTTVESGQNIVDNGLDFAASKANIAGSKAPGSFFTVPVDQADKSAALETALFWGSSRHEGSACVIVCRLPKSVVEGLESQGLLRRTDAPVQAAFHPGSYATVNRHATWFGPIIPK